MASRETLNINFEDDEVQANLNVKELTFQDLDHWVRSRFGLVNSDSLRYMNKLGAGKVDLVILFSFPFLIQFFLQKSFHQNLTLKMKIEFTLRR
jgi:hypothetical protein